MRWILGDIHGMRVALEGILEAVSAVDADARLYFVGDYINRGPDSRRVVELLLSLGETAKFVRGNHDDVLDLILNGRWLGGEDQTFDPVTACGWFLQHGLDDTLMSYGLDYADIDHHRRHSGARLLSTIRECFPDSHKAFFRDLPIIVEEEGLFVAHAFWPPEETNDLPHVLARLDGDASLAHRVIWERYKPLQILADKPWSRPAFFGHTPVSNYPPSLLRGDNVPIVGSQITLLDTAVALGPNGKLSAVCVEDGRLVQVDRDGEIA
jgi:serine/threonine protein phosphatase 1